MNKTTLIVASLFLAAFAAEASAKGKKITPELRGVTVSGKPSRGDIEGSCNSSGGFSYGTQAGSGDYGCVNFDNNTAVECDSQGNCTGLVPK